MSYPAYGLTFNRFTEANRKRCEESFKHDLGRDGWLMEQWLCAALGELGEAANMVKKMTRLQLDKDHEVSAYDVAREIADTVTYLDLACSKLGYDLGDVIADKFNEVSQRVESDIFLANPQD